MPWLPRRFASGSLSPMSTPRRSAWRITAWYRTSFWQRTILNGDLRIRPRLDGQARKRLRMPVKKTRRKLPEEDLAAAVAEIINSPITRANLAFLNPLPAPAPAVEEDALDSKPMGLEAKPMR